MSKQSNLKSTIHSTGEVIESGPWDTEMIEKWVRHAEETNGTHITSWEIIPITE